MKAITLSLLLALAACGQAVAGPPPADPPAKRPWLDPTGTAIVGFGLLRVVPAGAGKKTTFDIAYQEKPGDYGAGLGDEFQLFVLPGDCFAQKERAFADEFLAFTRTKKSDAGDYALSVSLDVDHETTLVVAYGPWTAPDAGRPPGDRPTFRIDVTSKDGGHEWIESEMGELITTNWTNRPEVKRGGPCRGEPLWIEVRPMILYDGRMVRAADEPLFEVTIPDKDGEFPAGADAGECKRDEVECAMRSSRQITMTKALVEKFRRVPIRWR